jgi:hypothetical protein
VTSNISKIFEGIIKNKINYYLEENKLISDRQYAFRQQRSTGDVLSYLTSTWHNCLEKFGETAAI